MRSILLLLLFPITAPALAQEKAPGRPTANHAIALALADAQNLNASDRLFTRYLWVKSGDTEDAQALADVLNRLSRTSLIKRPLVLGKDKLILLRFDVRWYAATQKDLAEWLTAWEELRFDPTMSLLLTRDTLAGAAKLGTLGELTRVWKEDGKVNSEVVELSAAKTDLVLRVLSPALDNKALLELMNVVVSTAPIVEADYFLARSLASIRDAKLFDGLYGVVYGGLYYDFAGVPATFDELLENLGVGNVKQKLRAEEVFNKLRSDKRVAISRSKVTAKRPRRVDFLPILGGDVFAKARFLSNTFDLKRADIDIGMHPIGNLLKTFRETTFHETLWTLPNGMIGAALWDDQFKRAEKAPDDLVKDHTVPAPFYGELQSSISCISCHDAGGHGGWQPVRNDVKKLVNRAGVVFDLNVADQTDALDRIRGLFSGDAETLLQPARDAFNGAVLEATGPWKASKANQTDAGQLSSQQIVAMWRRFFYDDVTAQTALADLGWDVPAEKAPAVLDALLKLPPGSLENAVIGILRDGDEVSRTDYDFARHFLAIRAAATLKQNPNLLEEMK